MADIRGIFKSVWRNLRASNADILLVTGKLINAKTTLALAAATDYAAEDVMAASDALAWRFKNVVEREGGSGIIIGSKALCGTTALPLWLTLFLFEATPTSNLTDNVANTALLAADLRNYIDRIDYVTMSDLGGLSEAKASPSTVGGLPISFTLESGRDIYGILVTRNAETGEAANMKMTLTLDVLQLG